MRISDWSSDVCSSDLCAEPHLDPDQDQQLIARKGRPSGPALRASHISGDASMAKSLGPVKRKFSPWTEPGAVPFIRFENITKRYGDFTAVSDLTLDIYEKEFFSLLGPSGCGKTTLMRIDRQSVV